MGLDRRTRTNHSKSDTCIHDDQEPNRAHLALKSEQRQPEEDAERNDPMHISVELRAY